MSEYLFFARFYDRLTFNVDYPARAAYFDRLIRRRTARPVEILLDLGCGTGSLAAALSGLGYDLICADASAGMLSVAASKAYSGKPPLFLRQPMEELDLYGTVDACVCALDTVNHLDGVGALEQAFGRVSLFLAPGGVFIFDVNTAYKHRRVLADNAYVYETPEVYCVWRNHCRENGDVEITLDFFTQEEGSYTRNTECFVERLFSPAQLENALKKAGLTLLEVLEGDTQHPPGETAQRAVYVAQKPL